MITQIKIEDLFITDKTWEWCQLPYPDHPKGCPNYGKKVGCPPQCPKLSEYFDTKKTMWLVITEFNLGEWANKMKEKHPNWSDRQARCCLYWQGKCRKRLKEGLAAIKKCFYNDTVHTLCPEAMGLNVIRTLRKLGVPIVSRPRDIVYKVAMFGYKKDRLIK
jgi:predicted metal-binding protein